jgi:mono/diheme cytochrome c family protein
MKSILEEYSKILTFLVFAAFLIVGVNSCKKEKLGCTDPLSDNYDPDAETDDGSCVYDQSNFDTADGIRGGMLYDKFYASETNWTGPSDGTISAADITGFGDFYRCKQCHGWDLLGKDGAYIGRAPKTTRPNVANGIKTFVASASVRELFDAIKKTGGRAVDPATTADGTTGSGDAHPDYGTILTDAQVWDLAKFLKNEVLDVDNLYDFTTTGSYPNGSIAYSNIGKNGDVVAGLAFYSSSSCGLTTCHGDDGTARLMEDRTLGKFLRDKPYEVHHKVKFGQPGSDPLMAATSITDEEMRDLYKLLADPVAFPD